MKNLRFTCLALLSVLFASGSAVGQSKFEVTPGFGARIRLEGKVKEALAFFEAQAREAEKNEQWADASRAYYGAMIVARSSGQLQKAIDYGAKAVETAEKTRDSALRILAANQIARIYADVRNFERAREFLEKALLIVKELPPNTPFRHRRQSALYSQLGADFMRRQEYEKAIDAFSQAHYLARVYLSSLGPRPQRTALETARFDLLDRLGELGGAYSQAGKLDDALQQYQQAFESIKEWGLKFPSEGNLYEGTGAERETSRRELAEAEKAYEAFLSKVRKQDKEQASLMTVEPLTLKEVQELLEPGVTVLEYFVTEQEVLLWIVEKNKAQFVRVPTGRKALVAKVTSLRESIYQVGEKEKFKASSQELYGLLIEPALSQVRGKELLIIPHDVLHYVPFQALLSPQGKYLIHDYPIYYLSSASLMQFTREKKRAGSENALVMGNPRLGDDAYNLCFAEREAREIARFYPHSAVYLRSEASKPRAISLSHKYDILHFAVHAELNEDDPMSSALLLAREGADDGRLKVGEIFSLALKAGMVVLSACETGLGKLSRGDELVGLTRAFIYAGTPSVVTTLWKLNDRASYELMREFYQHLKTAKKSKALRQAQLKTMQEFPEPFYWAAYELTGEP